MTEPSAYALNKEMDAARILKESLADLLRDDPDFLAEAIEAQTGLLEMIDALVLSVQQDKALSDATGKLIGDLSLRVSRIEARIDVKRAVIATALDLAEISKRECPGGTVSTRAVPPKLIITEEADIPAVFWKAQPPKLDRKAVHDILKGGAPVPGASLGNGGRTISIRT